MFREFSKPLLWLVVTVLIVSMPGCMRGRRLPPAGGTLPAVPLTETPVRAEAATPAVEPTSTPLVLPTATAAVSEPARTEVTVTAAGGNVYIRRGPGLAYNPIGLLADGESGAALARDILSDWVQVEIPVDPGQTGWVSVMTGYISIKGDVSSLPAVQVTDWPVAAYLRNCTYHEMLVQPGGMILPSLLQYPENEVWIYPGSYTVYDLDHPDTPEVAAVELREGVEIDIRVDGNDEKRKCP